MNSAFFSPPASPLPAGSSFYLYRVVMVAAVGGFLFGYDLALISGALLFIQREFSLSPLVTGAFVSSATLGCALGAMAGVWVADGWGRKRTLLASAVLFISSAVGCATARSLSELLAWRVVVGLGVGLASTVSPMYIAEIAPAQLRGRLVTVNQLAIVIGIGMAAFATYELSFGAHWRWMFASQLAPVAALVAGLIFVPESPRWLAARNRTAEAAAILQKISGPVQAQREMAEIGAELEVERGGLRELLEPGVLRALVIGIVLMVFQQVNGVNMILVYAPSLFMSAGVSGAPAAILNSVYVNGWILLCTIASFGLVRRFGRRPILVVGATAMAIGHGLMFAAFAARLPPVIVLIAMLVPTGAFTLTLAPVGWVVLSEIFPNRVRGAAMATATCVMFASSYLVSTFFPAMLAVSIRQFGNSGPAFLVFAAICLAGALFVHRFLPETQNRTLEEIARAWLGKERVKTL